MLKNQKAPVQTQAQTLYFQTDLSKTQIAELLAVPRTTLHYWIRENNWERQKKCAANMPSMLAENCYHIMAKFTQHLLAENRVMRPVTYQEADTLHKLTLTVNKLRNRYTLNESMELFGMFMDRVHANSPDLAHQLTPIVNELISAQAAQKLHDYRPDYFNSMGLIPIADVDTTENKLDMQDIMAWTEKDNPPADLDQLYSNDIPDDAALQRSTPEPLPVIIDQSNNNTQDAAPDYESMTPEQLKEVARKALSGLKDWPRGSAPHYSNEDLRREVYGDRYGEVLSDQEFNDLMNPPAQANAA